jgi:hypothetical protein
VVGLLLTLVLGYQQGVRFGDRLGFISISFNRRRSNSALTQCTASGRQPLARSRFFRSADVPLRGHTLRLSQKIRGLICGMILDPPFTKAETTSGMKPPEVWLNITAAASADHDNSLWDPSTSQAVGGSVAALY